MQHLNYLPLHIEKLEEQYKKAVSSIGNANYRSKKYYESIKIAQDIKKQIHLNKKINSLIGVKYGVQAKALEASS